MRDHLNTGESPSKQRIPPRWIIKICLAGGSPRAGSKTGGEIMKARVAVTRSFGAALAVLAVCGLAFAASSVQVYTVKKGDPLWEIASDKLGEGRQWPRIWENNRHIKDPHWIYPGNQVNLPGDPEVKQTAMTATAPDAYAVAPPPLPDVIEYASNQSAGFVSGWECERAGQI